MLTTRALYYGHPINWKAGVNKGLLAWWINLPHWMCGPVVTDLVGLHHGAQVAMGSPTSESGVGGTARPGGWGEWRTDGTDDAITCADTGDGLSPLTQMTLCWWGFQTAAGSDKAWMMKGNAFGSDWTYLVITQSSVPGQLQFYIANALNDDGSNLAYTSDSGWTAGVWQHVAMVFDGTQATNDTRFRLYMNAAPAPLLYIGTIPATLTNSVGPLRFGAGYLYFWNGAIDDMRLYNRALTPEEILDLYGASLTGYREALNWLSLPLANVVAAPPTSKAFGHRPWRFWRSMA
jgi:hypothetical protein